MLDTATEVLLPELHTDSPVLHLAISQDGNSLFLAMGRNGAKQLEIPTNKIVPITDRICAEFVKIDPPGTTLYVSYQCGGPGGRAGHDSLEAFDVKSLKSLGIVSGPPMVGGEPAISPDNRLLLLDGHDACITPEYDHKGCPAVPSLVLHFLWANSRSVFKSLPLPVDSGVGRFLDSKQFLLLNASIGVLDTATYALTEKWERPQEHYRGSAVDQTRRVAYVGVDGGSDVIALEAESDACSVTAEGLALSFTGDGVALDSVGGTQMTSFGDVRYGPGRVGQAFLLDGESGGLVAPWTGYYAFGYRDSSLALYVKFASTSGEMTILDRASQSTPFFIRFVKAADQHVAISIATGKGGPLELQSSTSVTPDRWYHLTFTKDDKAIALYVNGHLEDRKLLGAERAAEANRSYAPLYFGTAAGKKAFMHGKLDEILLYSRALTAQEVRVLYELRESGPCKM